MLNVWIIYRKTLNRMSNVDEWDSLELVSSTQRSQETLVCHSSFTVKGVVPKRRKHDILSSSDDHSVLKYDSQVPEGIEFASNELSEDSSMPPGIISEGKSTDILSTDVSRSDSSCRSQHEVSGFIMPEGITFSSSVNVLSDSNDLNPNGFSNEQTNHMLENMTESEYQSLNSSLKLKLAYLAGASAHRELKTIANKLVSRESRDIQNMILSDAAILTEVLKCETVHRFFEGLTQKSPRCDDEDANFAGLHVQAFECLMKCVNTRAIGIRSLKKNLQIPCASAESLDPGGNRKIASSLPVGEELPIRKGSGLLVGDNAQRGIGKLQKHSRFKWKRSEAHVSVQTHLVVYENEEDVDSLLFQRNDAIPSTTDYHPLFRPVSIDFLHIFKARLQHDEDIGYKVVAKILSIFLQEALQDVKVGNGVSSLSILQRQYEANSGYIPKVCQKCHFIQEYDPNSQNICASCQNNPTVYTYQESNPYLRFGFHHGKFKSVKSHEEESLDINPSSYASLKELLEHAHERQVSKGDTVSVLGLDGLPGIRIKRMQYDMVKCLTHDKMFNISSMQDCLDHNKEGCEISWPYDDKIILLGESHEEIFLNLRAASAATNFCLKEVLRELGKKSKANQEAAIKRRELNKLFPMNMTFLEGALKMMMVSYIESSWSKDFVPIVNDFITYCLGSSNSQVSSLFLSTYYFMMPALVKRLGLRLHRPDIADGGSALGFVDKRM